jgi:hypothetical protein
MPDRLVERAEIAKQLRLSERQIANLVKSAKLDDGRAFPSRVEGRSRKFPEDQCFEWFIRWKQEEAVRRSAGTAKSSDKADVALRQAEIDLGMAELRFAELRRDVVRIEEYRKELRRVLGKVAAKVRTITGEFAPRILEPLDMPKAVKLLRELQLRLLGELGTAGATETVTEDAREDVA